MADSRLGAASRDEDRRGEGGRERGADPFQVFGRALRIVSLIATKGRLCVEPTSSTRVAGLAFPARIPSA